MPLQLEAVLERQRPQLQGQRLGERLPLAAVEHRVVREIRRRIGLIGCHQLDEGFLGEWLKRVVRPALFADRRDRLLRERLPAQRAGAVRRVDRGSSPAARAACRAASHRAVRQGRWRTIRAPPGRSGLPTSPTNNVSPVSTACGTVSLTARSYHEHRDRFRRVPGCFEGSQPYTSEIDAVAVSEGCERVHPPARSDPVVGRPGLLVQLEMTGDEVGVKVRQDDVADREAALRGKRQVLIHVTLRIDHGSRAGLLVADEIRRVREAIEIELMEDHRIAWPRTCRGPGPRNRPGLRVSATYV